jgi:hypothetical protein
MGGRPLAGSCGVLAALGLPITTDDGRALGASGGGAASAFLAGLIALELMGFGGRDGWGVILSVSGEYTRGGSEGPVMVPLLSCSVGGGNGGRLATSATFGGTTGGAGRGA